MRKLEPSDAERVLVPIAKAATRTIRAIDALLRRGSWIEACQKADAALLVKGLGWSVKEVRSIQQRLAAIDKHK